MLQHTFTSSFPSLRYYLIVFTLILGINPLQAHELDTSWQLIIEQSSDDQQGYWKVNLTISPYHHEEDVWEFTIDRFILHTRNQPSKTYDSFYPSANHSVWENLLEELIEAEYAAEIDETGKLKDWDSWDEIEWKSEVMELADKNGYSLPPLFAQMELDDYIKRVIRESWSLKKAGNSGKIGYKKGDIHYQWRPDNGSLETKISGQIKNAPFKKVFFKRPNQGIFCCDQEGVELDELGRFEWEISLTEAARIDFSHKPEAEKGMLKKEFLELSLYVKPGEPLHVELDGRDFYQDLNFEGYTAPTNRLVNDLFSQYRPFHHYFTVYDHLSLSPLAFRNLIQKQVNKERAFVQNHPDYIAAEAREIAEKEIEIYYNLAHLTYIWRKPDQVFPFSAWYHQFLDEIPAMLEKSQSSALFDQILSLYQYAQTLRLKKHTRTTEGSITESYYIAKLIFEGENLHIRLKDLLISGFQYHEFETVSDLYHDFRDICQDEQIIREVEEAYENAENMQHGHRIHNEHFYTLDGAEMSLRDFGGIPTLFQFLDAREENLQEKIDELDHKIKTHRRLQIVHFVHHSTESQLEPLNSVNKIVGTDNQIIPFLRRTQIFSIQPHFLLIGDRGRIYMETTTQLDPEFLAEMMREYEFEMHLREHREGIQWQYFLVGAIVMAVFALLFWAFSWWRQRRKRKQEIKKRRIAELELKAIRAQLNPHFLFNALNAIQHLIRKKDHINADHYLTEFAGLMRKVLRNSETRYITLDEELSMIQSYAELESLRLPFTLHLEIDPALDLMLTEVPPLLIQPYVENAIIHGIATCPEPRDIWIRISAKSNGLYCEIEDNGIGFDRAQQSETGRKGYGLRLSEDRINLLGMGELLEVKIEDKSNLDPLQQGTKVSLFIPTDVSIKQLTVS